MLVISDAVNPLPIIFLLDRRKTQILAKNQGFSLKGQRKMTPAYRRKQAAMDPYAVAFATP